MRDSVAALQLGLTGSVRIGVILSSGSLKLSEALAGYSATYPGVEVGLELIPGPASTRLDIVREGVLDLALVPSPLVQPADVITHPIATAQLALVVPVDDVGGGPLSAAELAERPFIDFPLECGNRSVVDQYFAQRRLRRRVAIEGNDLAFVLDLVAAGAGVAFVPDTARHPGVAAQALSESPDPVALVLARSALHPATAAGTSMWTWLVEHAEQGGRDEPHSSSA